IGLSCHCSPGSAVLFTRRRDGAMRAMDADELARIEATLAGTIAEAKVVVRARGVDPQFKETVRHAREMHDILLDALRAGGSQVTERMWGQCLALGNAVDELELLDFLADGRFR